MTDRSEFFEALRYGLQEATGKPIGLSQIPSGEDLQGATLELPYAIIYPIVSSSAGAKMSGTEDSKDEVFQVTSVGKNPKQAGWMSDRINEVMTMKVGASYMYPLVDEAWGVEWRLCDQLGATLPTGRSMFNQFDNYRIRKGRA